MTDKRLRELEERIERLEEILDIEDTDESDETETRFGDHRDQAVLETLSVGSVYKFADLKTRYLSMTDIVSDDTVTQRIKRLDHSGILENAGFSKRRYVGDDDA